MQAILSALLKIILDVFVDLLKREDTVADEVQPELETMDADIDDADLVRRYGGLLDQDADPVRSSDATP